MYQTHRCVSNIIMKKESSSRNLGLGGEYGLSVTSTRSVQADDVGPT